jgi:ketosteroid isomerase-like protein
MPLHRHRHPISSFLVLAIAALAAAAAAVPPRTGGADAAGERAMADADRAFARLSRQQGMRAAFLAYLADDGVIFRPGPVPGRAFLEARPSPAIELTWTPVYAAVAASGDLGYTTGPYEVRGTGPDRALEDQGYYVTVWRKQADGSWKVAVDQGVSTPQLGGADTAALREAEKGPGGAGAPAASSPSAAGSSSTAGNPATAGSPAAAGNPPATGEPTAGAAASPPGATAAQAAPRPWLDADHAFAGDAGAHGARAAYMAKLAPDARLFREGAPPAVGREAVGKALAAGRQVASSWEPTTAAGSAAGDLGVTYGNTALMAPGVPGRIRESAMYLRVWQRQRDGSFKILLDLVKPLPAPRSP